MKYDLTIEDFEQIIREEFNLSHSLERDYSNEQAVAFELQASILEEQARIQEDRLAILTDPEDVFAPRTSDRKRRKIRAQASCLRGRAKSLRQEAVNFALIAKEKFRIEGGYLN